MQTDEAPYDTDQISHQLARLDESLDHLDALSREESVLQDLELLLKIQIPQHQWSILSR
jgi:cytochrome c556